MRGWPKIVIEVWEIDAVGRYSIGGYGVGTVPFAPGEHKVRVHCWRPRPQGLWERIAGSLVGTKPELEFKDILLSSADRFGMHTESTGVVDIMVGVIPKDFGLYGLSLGE